MGQHIIRRARSGRRGVYRGGRWAPRSSSSSRQDWRRDSGLLNNGSAALEQDPTQDLSIAPNPVVNDRFQLRIAENSGGTASWQILSLTGQVVRERQIEAGAGVYQEEVSTAGLARGTYLLRWRDERGEQTRRFAVQ